ncbi:hypothetical protein FRC17_001549, partial [Serendipita sp. 399]
MAQVARKAARAAASSASKPSIHSSLTYTPPVALKLGPTHLPRLRSHYEITLTDDLMYLHYQHHDANFVPPTPPKRREHEGAEDGSNPYASNRPPPRPKGNKQLRPLTTNVGGKLSAAVDGSSPSAISEVLVDGGESSSASSSTIATTTASSSSSTTGGKVEVRHTGKARID